MNVQHFCISFRRGRHILPIFEKLRRLRATSPYAVGHNIAAFRRVNPKMLVN
jgi:hypothetical protein